MMISQYDKLLNFNPLVTNGLSHPYHLDEFTFNFRGIGSNFLFLFHFSMKIMSANRIAPDGMPRFAASHLGLFCLPMSHKKDAGLIWANYNLLLIHDRIPNELDSDITRIRHPPLKPVIKKCIHHQNGQANHKIMVLPFQISMF